jgi:hypothetical protein
MRAREHRGNLADSLTTVFNINTKKELLDEINERMGTHLELDDIAFVHHGMDSRILWDTYLVSVRGYGVFGYTDGKPQ